MTLRTITSVLLTTLVGWSAAGPGDGLAREVAEAHGLSSWDSVETIRHTFNVRRDAGNIHRAWEWEPQTGRVTLVSSSGDEETPFTFNTHAVTEASPENVRTADHRFINDRYWLLFPFHLVWDADVTLIDQGMQPNPVGEGSARQLRVEYGSEGGYTPGDTYLLHLAPDNTVGAWTFIRGGEGDGSAFAWQDPAQVGPLTIYQSYVRDGSDEPGIFFTDVSAVIDGEEVEASGD